MSRVVLIGGWGFKPECMQSVAEVCRGRAKEVILASYSALDPSILSKETTVVGWSLGSMIALNYAINYPELVNKLVLFAPTLRFAGDVQGLMRNLKVDAAESLKRFCALVCSTGAGAKIDRQLLRQVTKSLVNPAVEQDDLEAGLCYLAAVDLTEKILKVHCPVTVVHGAKDQVVPVAAGREVFLRLNTATRGRSSILILPELHHALPFLSATAYDKLI